jgi:Protein of unknown function (DUF3761)
VGHREEPNQSLMTAADRMGMNRVTSPAKAAAVAIGVLILGGVAGLAYSEQRPGDCGYYTNSNGHQVPRPCGNSKIDAPPSGATAICRDGSYSFSEHPYAAGTCSHHGGVESHLTR